MVYLDNNATTAIAPEVLEAMLPLFKTQWGNPSSLHTFGSNTKRCIEDAREKVAALLGASDSSEIIFTSGGSESNTMALLGAVSAMPGTPTVLTSEVEHSAVLGPYAKLEKENHSTIRMAVDELGNLDLGALKAELAKIEGSILASFMWANNETGVIFPMKELADLVHEADGLLHTDAIQAAGKIPVNVQNVPVDMLSISGHKIYAPKGIGALYLRRGTRLEPLILGGQQERARRAGTENVPYIVGLGKACELAQEQMEQDAKREQDLRDRLEQGILSTCKRTMVNGDLSHRLPNTCNISFDQLEGEAILLMLDDAGICASAGSACQSGSIEVSHVLKAMNLPRSRMQGAIRLSVGRYTTEADVDAVLKQLPAMIDRQRALTPLVQG